MWEAFKQQATTFLLDYTRRQKTRKTAGKHKLLETILNKVTTEDSVDGPTDDYRKLTAQIKGAIAGEKERLQPPEGWLSYIRTLGGDVFSKIFYRNFKQKHANNTIGSLHVTLDWNDAESKAGETTTDEETLGEAADYYRWLYRGKKAGGSLSFFTSLLKRKQVPSNQAKSIDKDITEAEVVKCIRRMAKGKAPGADGLPSEFYQAFESLIAPDLTRVFREILQTGELPGSFEEGEIILLYKKQDSLDIRS
jgi:hypothetical protein